MIALDPPRWPGGPRICPVANLPAFQIWADAAEFLDALHGSAKVKWICRHCEHWHFWGDPNSYAPAGQTSGTCRASKIPAAVVELMNDSKIKP